MVNTSCPKRESALRQLLLTPASLCFFLVHWHLITCYITSGRQISLGSAPEKVNIGDLDVVPQYNCLPRECPVGFFCQALVHLACWRCVASRPAENHQQAQPFRCFSVHSRSTAPAATATPLARPKHTSKFEGTVLFPWTNLHRSLGTFCTA